MKTSELFRNKTVLSFEIFPPKPADDDNMIYETLDGITGLTPDFISVTYGAGGGANAARTIETAATIKHRYGIESVAHLKGIELSRDAVLRIIQELKENQIENVLALRGDITADSISGGVFRHADELVAYLRENGEFNIIAACYPEGHRESRTLAEDIENLKRKVDAGASQLITQLFLNNEDFYKFLDMVRSAGINVPIQAGIMPVTNKKSIERMVKMCGIKFPPKFKNIVDKYEHNPQALRDAGLAYAIDQIVDLLAHDVDGIHLYIMNRPYIAKTVCGAIQNMM